MNRKLIFVLLNSFVVNQINAGTGNFFNVTTDNNAIVIKTTVPNHTYSQAGLQI